MSGVVVPILPMSDYNFSFLSGTLTRTVQLHRALTCAPFYYGTLELRVHDHNLTSGQSIALQAWGTNPSREDPTEFTELTSTWQVTVSTTAAPYLERRSLSDIPAYLKILLRFTQGPTTGTAFYARLSADLVLREA